MIVYHVAVATAADCLDRRDAGRRASSDYLMALRARGAVIAAGAAPDGRACDLFCRVQQPQDIGRLVEDSPLYAERLWTGYTLRSFAQFLEPWDTRPSPPDETRVLSLVEGMAPDPEMASFALIEERGAGRLRFGGFFADGSMLALMTSADPGDAARALDRTGLFTPGTLRGRSLVAIA